MRPAQRQPGEPFQPLLGLHRNQMEPTPAAEQEWQEALQRSRPRPLRCRACTQVVTVETQAVTVHGRHVHRRRNPAGIEFEFGCFSDAAGAVSSGEPTLEFTWFPSHAWVYASCRRCNLHLGWFFDDGESGFYALILDRLTREEPQGQGAAEP